MVIIIKLLLLRAHISRPLVVTVAVAVAVAIWQVAYGSSAPESIVTQSKLDETTVGASHWQTNYIGGLELYWKTRILPS